MSNKDLKCSIEGCSKKQQSRGWCAAHYKRWLLHGDPMHGGALKNQGGLCAVDGCDAQSRRWGYCAKHSYLFKTNGDPLLKKSPFGEAQDFYKKVVLEYDGDDCLDWKFKKDKDGYGIIWRQDKNHRVHRIVCEDVNGPPASSDLFAIHSCGNGHLGCCNPKHIRWGTAKKNSEDRETHGRTSKGVKHWISKFTDDDIREIRRLEGTMSQEEIASAYGVTQGAISHILTGKTWRHIK